MGKMADEQPVTTEQDSVQRLAEIRERADKATPGPYRLIMDTCDCGGDYPCSHGMFAYAIDGPDGNRIADSLECTVEDGEFIAHSREDVPYLLDLIDSLTAERDHERHRKEVAEFEREEVRCALTRVIEAADARVEAAEADRERLREALDGIKRTSYGTFTGMPESILIGHITSVHTQAEAALATPPSEEVVKSEAQTKQAPRTLHAPRGGKRNG